MKPAGRRSSNTVTAVTAVAALMPTFLSAQGMVSVGHDILRLPIAVALGLAVFLEAALVSSALLARDAALVGRPSRADLFATWVFSAVSGIFSAAHELVVPLGHGTTWRLDAGSGLAAAIRIAAPLVAAWLWHRILCADQHTSEGRTFTQVRHDRLMLQVATAALAVRRAEGERGDPALAQQQLDRVHRRLLRAVPATDPIHRSTLPTWLGVVGSVDGLPAGTVLERAEPQAPAVAPDTGEQVPPAGPAVPAIGAPLPDAHDVPPERPQIPVTDTPAVVGTWKATGFDEQEKLAVTLQVLHADPAADVDDVVAAFGELGRPCSQRTARLWLARAREALQEQERLSMV